MSTGHMRNKRLYNIWACMRQRCNNPKHTAARWYHDRGIRVCKDWDSCFKPFEIWALSSGYADDLTIDRIDPDGDYCPDNCRWIPRKLNAQLARRGSKKQEIRIKVKQPKVKQPKVKQPRVGKFSVMSYPRYKPFYGVLYKVEITGLTKPEAYKMARKLAEEDKWGPKGYDVRVSDDYKEGEYVLPSKTRQYIKSSR